jgi:hypothetical protein
MRVPQNRDPAADVAMEKQLSALIENEPEKESEKIAGLPRLEFDNDFFGWQLDWTVLQHIYHLPSCIQIRSYCRAHARE